MGIAPRPVSRWELAAEAIAVKIRWFGLLVGSLLVAVESHWRERFLVLFGILALGPVYTVLDTWHSVRGRVFLGRYPISIACMEALFIGLLCYFDRGLESSSRYYYFLSLVCCAIRQPPYVTYLTCRLHCSSYAILYLTLPVGQPVVPFALTLVVLV